MLVFCLRAFACGIELKLDSDDDEDVDCVGSAGRFTWSDTVACEDGACCKFEFDARCISAAQDWPFEWIRTDDADGVETPTLVEKDDTIGVGVSWVGGVHAVGCVCG